MNVRAALSLVLLPAVAMAFEGPTVLQVTLNGKALGEARVTQRLTAGGGKSAEFLMTLKNPIQTVQIRHQASFDAKGNPVRKLMRAETVGKRQWKQIIATFDAAGANIVIEEGGSRKTQKVPLTARAPRADASELWFIRDHPKPGAVVKAYTFNLDSLEWEMSETTYIGATVRGHHVKTHREGHDSDAFFDEEGNPISIQDSTGLVMKRR